MADEAIIALLDTAPPRHDGSPYAPYLIARLAEWESESDLVTVWRGPEKPDERLPRMRLRPIDCETLLVTELGFWDCIILYEELKPLVETAAEKRIQEEADCRLAESWSYDEVYREDFGDEVFVTATFGDCTAVNGEQSGNVAPPRGYVLTDRGGRIPSEETEIYKDDWLYEYVLEDVRAVAGNRRVPEELIDEIIDELYPNKYFSWGGSGDSEVWVSKNALRLYEAYQAKTDEERRIARLKELRRQAAVRRRRIREQIRKGKGGSKQDWSPRGRIPGFEA